MQEEQGIFWINVNKDACLRSKTYPLVALQLKPVVGREQLRVQVRREYMYDIPPTFCASYFPLHSFPLCRLFTMRPRKPTARPAPSLICFDIHCLLIIEAETFVVVARREGNHWQHGWRAGLGYLSTVCHENVQLKMNIPPFREAQIGCPLLSTYQLADESGSGVAIFRSASAGCAHNVARCFSLRSCSNDDREKYESIASL